MARVALSPLLARGLALVLLLLAAAVHAAAPAERLDAIEHGLAAADVGVDRLREWQRELTALRGQASACVTEREAAKARLQRSLEALADTSAGVSAPIRAQRDQLQRQIRAVETALAECRLQLVRIDDLAARVSARYKAAIAGRLVARGPNLLVLLADSWEGAAAWPGDSLRFLRDRSGLEDLDKAASTGLLLALAIGLLLGFAARRGLTMFAARQPGHTDLPSRLLLGAATSLAHYAPQLGAALGLALVSVSLWGEDTPAPFLARLFEALPGYLAALVTIRLFLAPPPPAGPIIALPGNTGHRLARRLKVLALLGLLGYLLFATLLSQTLPESLLLLIRAAFAGVLVVNLAWALWLVVRLPALRKIRGLGLVVNLVLLGVLVAEWLGYRNLSVAALRALFGTGLVLALIFLADRVLRDLFDSLDQGVHRWCRGLRRLLGLSEHEAFPGLLWVRIASALLLWGAGLFALLRVWGVSDSVLLQLRQWTFDGFEVGSLRIVPVRLAAALLVLSLLVAFSGWVRTRLERRLAAHSRLDHGAREAMVAITGYLLVAVAILIGLGVAGVAFSNLAIIAGALSVGIGFGLQNIVNNFVSGLILLFERPIKTGDWVVVGSTEGYVKRIRIRSTQIQTFDRADVIVPNSELISTQVTNWMLYDRSGRARVPVGVAYGSDTAKVREVLMKVAREHPAVVTDGSLPGPRVLFLGFGDSALNFELRVFIRNIDERLGVVSDLNFAIDQAFREAGIEIPFPQRDLHLRDWPPLPPAERGERD